MIDIKLSYDKINIKYIITILVNDLNLKYTIAKQQR